MKDMVQVIKKPGTREMKFTLYLVHAQDTYRPFEMHETHQLKITRKL